MTNNSLKETHPFELNFSFIYDYPNKYIQIERKKNEHYFNHFHAYVHCIRITGSLDACKTHRQ